MSYNVERFKELNREEWTDPSVVDGWRKWHKPFSEWLKPITQKMVDDGEIQSGMQVLDLASGSGDPAISFARIVGPTGHVTATDFNPEMLSVAEANAKEAAVENMVFEQADAHSLRFDDESFDRVTCRFGVMYFGDHVQALREMRRVLKPRGRVVLIANGPFEQPFIENTLGVLIKHIDMPPGDPDAPDTFRFSPDGFMHAALQAAGFRDMREEHGAPDLFWPSSPMDLWQWFVDIAAPFKPLLAQLSQEQRKSVFEEIETALGKFSTGDGVKISLHYTFGTAIK
jgi:SAM-dependent methyltransferase